MLCCAILKFLTRGLNFHFMQGPADCVTSPAYTPSFSIIPPLQVPLSQTAISMPREREGALYAEYWRLHHLTNPTFTIPSPSSLSDPQQNLETLSRSKFPISHLRKPRSREARYPSYHLNNLNECNQGH